MKHLSLTLILLSALAGTAFQCSTDPMPETCTVPAVVRDLSGLDGCGFVFELTDGTKLIPVWDWGWCGTPPLPKGATEDPLYNFEYSDGKMVMIGYVERNDFANVCMAGKTVKITCIKEAIFTPAL
ncbi:MAG: hypothetical protein KF845_02110 [Cyclobacteriaceae bacterium]|nr:hypothetical protein [Cyclobacteriaceae bacterium]